MAPSAYSESWWIEETHPNQKAKTTWHRRFQSKRHYRDIMWTDPLEIAREHWDWVIQQPFCRTRQDASEAERQRMVDSTGCCLVAVLFVPSNAGAYFFLSTIPRGEKATEMREKG
jgi:hypothetical protein